MPDHRVPLLGDAWRRREDPESSRNPAVRAVVRELSSVANLPVPAPAPAFRAELRAQLVAITPRVVAESIAAETAMVDIIPRPEAAAAPKHADVVAKPRFSFGRVVGIAACLVTAFALLLGGAVVMSRKALPGDTLYGLKRASERFQLATDGSDTERASDLLSFATTRTDEARQLLGRASASGQGAHATAISDSTAALILSTLASGNSDVTDASRLLAEQAVADGSAAPLTNMTNWAPKQAKRLGALWAAMPTAQLRNAAAAAKTLVTAAQARAVQLIPVVDSACMSDTAQDTLGPKPCRSASVTSGSSTTPTSPGSTNVPQAPIGSASPLKPVTGSPVTAPASGGLGSVSSPKPGSGALPTKPNLPTLPVVVQTPSLPVSAGSCGATVSVGGVKVGVGTCGGVRISTGP